MRSRKGVLFTLVTVILLVLMLAELITYVTINMEYSNLGTSASVILNSGSFTQSIGTGTAAFLHDSLARALNALTAYESNATLRKGNFVNNTALELESLMNNGTIYGNNAMKAYMNGSTLASYINGLEAQAGTQSLELSIENSSLNVYQDSPFSLNASYTALAIINSSQGLFTYPINAKASVSLNGTMDLYSVESGNPQQIDVQNNTLVTLVGGTRAVAGSSSPFMFDYGTLLVEPSGIVCSSIPSQYRNENYILATSDAADVNQSVCNMGGLVTNVTNSSTPLKPYLVYSNSANIFNYLQNGTKALLSGSSLALLNISGLKSAYSNNYYYSSLSSPSYLEGAESHLSQNSPEGLFSLGSNNRYVARFNGQSSNVTTPLPTTAVSSVSLLEWVYIPSLSDHGGFVKLGSVGGDGYGIGVGGSDWDNAGNTLWGLFESVRWFSCNTAIGVGWHFVGLVISSNGVPSCYLDGRLTATVSGSNALPPSPALYIGSDSGYATRFFNGSVSDVQVYNTPLSSVQIQQLYQEGIGGAPISNAVLVGWWPLNGNANDYSGNNYNGTPTNMIYSSLNNFVGNPLKDGAVINPYNYQTVAGFGCNNAASCNSSSLFMPSSSYVLPITLINSQATAAPAPFQQMITFNPSQYSAYEASNLGNIRFYQGGSELYSWCESGCSTASSNTIFWVKLPNGIPASSNVIINMTFGATSTNYDGVYAGEAPQLSPTYAEYDNGANVFNFYDNFAGTSLNINNWGTTGSPTVSVSNGLTLGGSGNNYIGTKQTFSSGVYDSYMKETSSSSSLDYGQMIQYSYSTNTGFLARASGLDGTNTGGYWNADNNAFTELTSYSITIPTQTSMFIQSVDYTSATAMLLSVNYNDVASASATSSAYTSGGVGFRIGSSGAQIFVQWVRVRAYPPNGVMPSVAFEGINPLPTFGSSLGQINGALLLNSASFNTGLGKGANITTITPSPLLTGDVSTMAVWIKWNGAPGGGRQEILGADSSLGNEINPIIAVNDSGTEEAETWVCTSGSCWAEAKSAAGTIQIGKWYFLVSRYNGSDVSIWIDGVQQNYAGASGTFTMQGSGDYAYIGSRSNTGDYFNGMIADAQIYNAALSEAQIWSLYLNNSVQGISPIAYWPLGNGESGLMNVTPDVVSGNVKGILNCVDRAVINGTCGVSFTTASGN